MGRAEDQMGRVLLVVACCCDELKICPKGRQLVRRAEAQMGRVLLVVACCCDGLKISQ